MRAGVFKENLKQLQVINANLNESYVRLPMV